MLRQNRESALLHHLLHPLLHLLARLAGLLLNAIDDLVRVVARFVHVLLRELVELVDELLLQLRRAVADLLPRCIWLLTYWGWPSSTSPRQAPVAWSRFSISLG